MSTSLYFTPEDRDQQGFVRVDVPPTDAPPSEAETPPIPAEVRTPRHRHPEPPVLAPPLTQRQTAALLLALALIAIVAMALLSRVSPASPMRATVMEATAAAAPTIPAPTATPRMLVTYWAPGGEKAPPISASTPMTPTGRYGQDWLLERINGGQVWLNMDEQQLDRTDVFLALPDLAPRPTPEPRPAPAAVPASTGDTPAAAATVAPALSAATAAPTFDSVAYQKVLDATSTSVYATAAALGAPGGVVPFTPTPAE